jgi:branched-chain amino acid transport system ATP-binding protein
MSILEAEDIGIHFGGVVALQGVSFAVEPGEVFSIIGPNGAGKTTLFNIVTGIYKPDSGRIKLDGAAITGMPPHRLVRLGMARTFQNLQIFFRMTALENVMVGCHLYERSWFAADLLGLPSVFRQNRATEAEALSLLARLGLEEHAQTVAGSLPYGVLKKLEIARALATRPKILLLDEPAAGCNAVETGALEAFIAGIAASGAAVVLIEHDMKLVMKISSRILVLAQGRRLTEGTPAKVRADPAVIAAYLGDHGTREASLARSA